MDELLLIISIKRDCKEDFEEKISLENIDLNCTKYEDTPLITAVLSENVYYINRLLDKGASVHQRSRTNISPLSAAVAVYNIEILEMLLARGANIQDAYDAFIYEGDMNKDKLYYFLNKLNKGE